MAPALFAASIKQRSRLGLGITLALSHLSLVGLAAWGRLLITVPSSERIVQQVLESGAWPVLHALVGLWLLAACLADRLTRQRIPALAAAAGVFLARGVLGLIWGVTTIRPVSLVGPVFTLALGIIAYLLAGAWAAQTGMTGGERRGGAD